MLAATVYTAMRGGRRARFSATGLRQQVADLRHLAELFDTGALRPVIDRRYALDDIVAAHRYVDTGRKRATVIVTP